jgi:halimadienyl-diphosphate synthase
VQKVLRFLQYTQVGGLYWLDKWHASPFYTSPHAVIACAGFADNLVQNTVAWILATQHPDGGWGYYLSTAEETAGCLQALVAWRRAGHQVPDDVFERGATWLAAHADPPYPPLWIGKSLYAVPVPIRSAVLSALVMVEGL